MASSLFGRHGDPEIKLRQLENWLSRKIAELEFHVNQTGLDFDKGMLHALQAAKAKLQEKSE
jgi:hypothetical protein